MKPHARLGCLSATLLIASFGCHTTAADQEATHEQQAATTERPAPSDATVAAGANAMQEVYTPLVEITAEESKSQGLPAATIVLDTGKQGLTGWKFSEKGEYLVLSGPPGGPLGLQVTYIARTPKNEADWKRLIETRYKERSPEPGTLGEIKLGDKAQPAYTFSTDTGPGRSHHIMTLYPVPKSKGCIMVDFFAGGGQTPTPTPKAMVADKQTAHVLKSLSIEFE